MDHFLKPPNKIGQPILVNQGCSRHDNQSGPHIDNQPMETTATLYPTSPKSPMKIIKHSKYCAICTPLGKICLKEFPMSSDWDDDEE